MMSPKGKVHVQSDGRTNEENKFGGEVKSEVASTHAAAYTSDLGGLKVMA